jgi:uncharacterized membrane protein YfcA
MVTAGRLFLVGGAPGTGHSMPKHDPYMRDRNITRAASLHIVAGLALGAGTGYAMAGWFGFSTALGAVVGAVLGFLLGNVLVYQYGGRSTR